MTLWVYCVELLYYKVLLVIAIILKLVCTIPIILVQCSSEGLADSSRCDVDSSTD